MAPRGGGRGGARGGRSRNGTARIAGIEIAVEEDFQTSTEVTQPGELYPKRELRPTKAISREEKSCIAAYCSLRDRIHEGPLYTVLGENVRVRKETAFGSSALIVSDPFEQGVETYSLRYAKKKRRLPKLDEGHYVLKFFPKELWGVLDPRYATPSATQVRKKAVIDAERNKRKLDALAAAAEAGAGAGGEGATGEGEEEKLFNEDGEESDQEAGEEEVVDDEFDEDEDDMAGDYNAEQYFDDGGDDAGDDYDGGDGGGDDGMY